MTVQGVVKNGVVVLQGDVPLAEGTMVSVTPIPLTKGSADEAPEDEALYRIIDLAGPGGIPDLSTNLDHYLYGHPKVRDAGR